MKNLIKIIILYLTLVSCTKTPVFPSMNFSFGGGVYILNEGNFRGNNGSLSFYSYDSTKIYNDVYNSVNGETLGDVPNAMVIKGDKAYILVNNSGKIEVVDQTTIQSKATIKGLISPRNMAVINDNKAYVSSLYSDSVAIINLADNIVSGYINLRRTSEAIVIAGNKAFISNWAGGKEIMVINTINDVVVDSITVGAEPESMAIDKNGMIWVLCNGGWMKKNNAELVQINTYTNTVEKTLIFPSIEASPTCLRIDGLRQTLYFLENGVKQMDITDGLPGASFIEQKTGQYFYKIAINPINGDIFVTDAVDFAQLGYVMIYTDKGTFVTKQKAGIIPGSMCFRLRINS
jgi:DNA-binding beta-propeller fold protein YncE